MKPALVIVDMQPECWGAAKNPVLVDNIIHYINEWQKRNLPIVVVTYYGSGKTHRKILSNLKNKKQVTFVRKYDCGGGHEILSKVNKKKISHFVMTGVFRCQCVIETANELEELANKPTLIVKTLTGCDEKDIYCMCHQIKQTSKKAVDKLLKAA